MKYLFKILLIVLISFSVANFAAVKEKSSNKEVSEKVDKKDKSKKTNQKNSKLDKSLSTKQSKNAKKEKESLKESSGEPISSSANNNEPVNSEIWVQEKENIADYNNVASSTNENAETENAPSSNKPFQIIGFILLFLGLIVGIMVWSNYSVSNKNNKKRNNLPEENEIMNLSNFEILDKLDLENGKNIYLIRLLNRKFLIGISWNGISLLSDLSDLELPTENNNFNSAINNAKTTMPASSDNNLDFMTLQNYAYENNTINNDFDLDVNGLEKTKKNTESIKNTTELPSINEQSKNIHTISNRSNKSIIKEEIKAPINTDFSQQTTLRKSQLAEKSNESLNKFRRPAWLEERESEKKAAAASLNFPVSNNAQNTTSTIKQAQAEINSIIALVPNKLNDIPEILPEQNSLKEKKQSPEVLENNNNNNSSENQEIKEEVKFERKMTSNIGNVSRKISLVEE